MTARGERERALGETAERLARALVERAGSRVTVDLVDVFEALDRSVLQPDERALIVPSTLTSALKLEAFAV